MPHGQPHFGTRTDFGQDLDIAKLTPKQQCKADGGVWDERTQTCVLFKPEPEPEPEPTPLIKIDPATVPKGANIVTDRFGNERIQTRQDVELEKAAFGGIGAKQALQEKEAEQLRVQQLVSQIGQLGKLDPAVQADINFSQAFTAGAAKVIPAAIGGAAVGAAAGLVGSAGVLSVPAAIAVGAAAGAGGFVAGVISNIKEQQKGELQAADIELTNARTNMRQLAMLASQDLANADIYIQQYNDQLTRVHQARRQTQAEVKGDLNAWIEDGREQLADFDAFLREGGIADIYGQKLAIALASGVPLSINGDQLI